MHPLSNERAEWLRARLFLLDRMIREFNEHTPRYQSSQGMVRQHAVVMNQLEAERLTHTIEHNTLKEYLAAQAARAQTELITMLKTEGTAS